MGTVRFEFATIHPKWSAHIPNNEFEFWSDLERHIRIGRSQYKTQKLVTLEEQEPSTMGPVEMCWLMSSWIMLFSPLFLLFISLFLFFHTDILFLLMLIAPLFHWHVTKHGSKTALKANKGTCFLFDSEIT